MISDYFRNAGCQCIRSWPPGLPRPSHRQRPSTLSPTDAPTGGARPTPAAVASRRARNARRTGRAGRSGLRPRSAAQIGWQILRRLRALDVRGQSGGGGGEAFALGRAGRRPAPGDRIASAAVAGRHAGPQAFRYAADRQGAREGVGDSGGGGPRLEAGVPRQLGAPCHVRRRAMYGTERCDGPRPCAKFVVQRAGLYSPTRMRNS